MSTKLSMNADSDIWDITIPAFTFTGNITLQRRADESDRYWGMIHTSHSIEIDSNTLKMVGHNFWRESRSNRDYSLVQNQHTMFDRSYSVAYECLMRAMLTQNCPKWLKNKMPQLEEAISKNYFTQNNMLHEGKIYHFFMCLNDNPGQRFGVVTNTQKGYEVWEYSHGGWYSLRHFEVSGITEIFDSVSFTGCSQDIGKARTPLTIPGSIDKPADSFVGGLDANKKAIPDSGMLKTAYALHAAVKAIDLVKEKIPEGKKPEFEECVRILSGLYEAACKSAGQNLQTDGKSEAKLVA